MTTIATSPASNSSTATQYTATTSQNAYGNAKSTAGVSTLSQADFLNLLTTQLQNQDPTSPESDEDMASQMAQFSQLTAMGTLNTTVSGLSGLEQVSSGASLIGQNVTTSATDSSGNAISGTVQSVGITNGAMTVDVNGTSVDVSKITGVQPASTAGSSANTGTSAGS